MSVKGMMQTVLVTELKQIQQDISNEALHYVVDNFSQMFDVREILAEENQELFQSNKNLTIALDKVSDYNLRLEESNKSFVSALQKAEAYNVQLENDRDAWVATIGHMIYLIERVYNSYKNNTGYEPSLSVFHRDLDEAYRFLDKTPKQCLVEIKADAVEDALAETYDEIRYRIGKDFANNIETIISDYVAKMRQGGE